IPVERMALNVAYTIAEVVISVLSIVGNGLVCIAVMRTRHLQTITNYFIVSLAVADICVGIVAIPSAILEEFGLPRHNFHLCVLMLSSIVVFTESSVLSLLAVAVERYLAIFSPLRYQALMTHRNALITILIAWIFSIVIGLVPTMGWHLPPPKNGNCFFILVVNMSYNVNFIFFGCFLPPLLFMFFIYTHIFLEVRRQLRKIATEGDLTKKEIKTATSLFLVLFIFCLCWLPLHIINIIFLHCPSCYMPFPLVSASIILSHINSAVNPIFYSFRMRSFRRAFLNIILCRGDAADVR
uniref:Adenosine receptor B1a n=1 Tax=Eptatretus burgeri TaxID=7764 RepID=A0A8C4R8H4_EPTBU